MNHDLTDYYARALIVVVKSFIAHEAKRFTTFAFSVDEAPKSVFQIRTIFFINYLWNTYQFNATVFYHYLCIAIV